MKYINFFENSNKESSVAVVSNDGTLDLVYTEERYNRKKYSDMFPRYSLDAVVGKINDSIKMYNKNDKERYIFRTILPSISFNIKNRKPYAHHLLHCYESFYTSGFDKAAVLVADGYGEDPELGEASMVLYHKVGTMTKVLKKYDISRSLGMFYTFASSFLGFEQRQEGKFMGLAAYGKPFDERFITYENGEIIKNYDLDDWKRKYCVIDTHTLDIINASNFAATVQRDLNECILGLLKDLKKLTNEENLCLSGGIFNNVITNNLICESGLFKNIWCSPAPSDYGLSVGVAYFSYECDDDNAKTKKLSSPYLGEDYTDEMLVNFFKMNDLVYEEMTLLEIAQLLQLNKVIVWFQGRSEYGRRALGHRSILANPFYRENYKKVSIEVKRREEYRPLACTVPSELFDLMFDVKNTDLTEFMLRAIPVRKEICGKIPACLAIDGTTRPQRLERNINSEFYDMIMEFYKLTGIPCVVNTSLNGGGEPIIENIKDCVNFLKSNANITTYGVFNGKYVIRAKTINNNEFKSVERTLSEDKWKMLYGELFNN